MKSVVQNGLFILVVLTVSLAIGFFSVDEMPSFSGKNVVLTITFVMGFFILGTRVAYEQQLFEGMAKIWHRWRAEKRRGP